MKKYIFLFLVSVMTYTANGQTIQDVMKTIPEDNITGLSPSTVQFLLENANDSIAKTSNYLSDNVFRDLISNDYVRLKTSTVGTTEIKLLPLINDSKVIAVLKTVCGTVCDSQLYFFTDKWKSLDAYNLLPNIDVEWFLTADETLKKSDNYNYVKNLLNNSLPIQYEFSPHDQTMKLSVDPSLFLDQQTYSQLKEYFNSTPKTLKWNKISFGI